MYYTPFANALDEKMPKPKLRGAML